MNTPHNSLFSVSIKVRRGPGCDMPTHLVGAYVDCFVAAPDHLSAIKVAAAKLSAKGFIFEDIVGGKIDQIDIDRAHVYIASKWPEMLAQLPSQREVTQLVTTGGVLFGPFAAWEREA